MPIYDIEHVCSLSDTQQEQLAEAITKIHSEKFTTPRIFVNVNFKNIKATPVFVAGKRRPNNRIIANTRHGPSRTQEMYDALCAEIEAVWADVVGTEGEKELRGIFVLGSIVAGSEAGFPVPRAGQDAEWMKKNMAAFKKKAAGGDTDFQDMLDELNSRDAFKGIVNGA